MSGQDAVCDKKISLLKAYNLAVLEYCDAVCGMMMSVGQKEFGFISHHSEEARARCDAARNALEKHLSEHGC